MVVVLNLIVLFLMARGIFGITFIKKNDYMKNVLKKLNKGPSLDIDFGDKEVDFDSNVKVGEEEPEKEIDLQALEDKIFGKEDEDVDYEHKITKEYENRNL